MMTRAIDGLPGRLRAAPSDKENNLEEGCEVNTVELGSVAERDNPAFL
jgi:hypothetical protein